MVREISKSELIQFVETLKYDQVIKNLSQVAEIILYTLEHMHYVDISEKIKKRKEAMELYTPNEFLTFYIPKNKTPDDISIGCQSCLQNKINHVRHVDQCNCSCDFCYYYGKPLEVIPSWSYVESMMRSHLDESEFKLLLSLIFYTRLSILFYKKDK